MSKVSQPIDSKTFNHSSLKKTEEVIKVFMFQTTGGETLSLVFVDVDRQTEWMDGWRSGCVPCAPSPQLYTRVRSSPEAAKC